MIFVAPYTNEGFEAAWKRLEALYRETLRSPGWKVARKTLRPRRRVQDYPQVTGFGPAVRARRCKSIKAVLLRFTRRVKVIVKETDFQTTNHRGVSRYRTAKGLVRGRTIHLNTRYSNAIRTISLIHELAHGYQRQGTSCSRMEIEAESVAFLVGVMLGVEPWRYAGPYVAWYSYGDVEKLRRCKGSIRRLTRMFVKHLVYEFELARWKSDKRRCARTLARHAERQVG